MSEEAIRAYWGHEYRCALYDAHPQWGSSLKGEGPSLPRSLDGPNLYVRDEEHLYVNAGQEPRESSCEFAKSIAA